MDVKARALSEFRSRQADLAAKRCLAGFDGFVDRIVSPVEHRTGPGKSFTPFLTLADFGRLILRSAEKSANIELYLQQEKPGGNGPILAGALAAQGLSATCIGVFGKPMIHPVFAELEKSVRLVSLGEPASTTALEFNDGKLMLGTTQSLEAITPEAITEAFGDEAYRDALATADLVMLGNWTMIPHMTEIYKDLTQRILPAVPWQPERIFFFDLADPEKRSREDLLEALEAISPFERFGRVTLGLNLKEAQRVAAALGITTGTERESALRATAERMREKLDLSTLVIHQKSSGLAVTLGGTWSVSLPYVDRPRILTGAGDHFNAGFVTGQLLDLDPEVCLALAGAVSGHYVRTSRSPSQAEIEAFLQGWH